MLELYECRRWADSAGKWMGALLINADSPEEAIKIFKEAEGNEPKSVKVIDLSIKGIRYDDEFR